MNYGFLIENNIIESEEIVIQCNQKKNYSFIDFIHLFIRIILINKYYLCEFYYIYLFTIFILISFLILLTLFILLFIESLINEEIQASILQFFKSVFLSDSCRIFMISSFI